MGVGGFPILIETTKEKITRGKRQGKQEERDTRQGREGREIGNG